MKFYFILAAAFTAGCGACAQTSVQNIGKKDCYLEVDGVERHFIVYEPAGEFPRPMPVVFMFHGASGNGERFYNISGWKEKADREGIIAVFPTAVRYCLNNEGRERMITRWNAGSLDSLLCEGQELKDDVLFFREMVKYLRGNYPVDEKRIYASGFSDGANITSRLTVQASDILSATAVVAGALQDTTWQLQAPISSFLAVGQMEQLLLNEKGDPLPLIQTAIEQHVFLQNIIHRMVDKLQLERKSTYFESDHMAGFIYDHSKSAAGNEFRFALISDLPHKYPNGSNHPLVMADVFWKFFKKHHK